MNARREKRVAGSKHFELPTKAEVVGNLRWGVAQGAIFAGLFSFGLLLLALGRGSFRWSSYGLSFGEIVLVYFVGCMLAGAVVGLLRPFTRWRLGAMLVGVVAAVPATATLGIAMSGNPLAWKPDDRFAFYGIIVTMGPLCGLIRWSQTWGRERQQKRGGAMDQ